MILDRFRKLSRNIHLRRIANEPAVIILLRSILCLLENLLIDGLISLALRIIVCPVLHCLYILISELVSRLSDLHLSGMKPIKPALCRQHLQSLIILECYHGLQVAVEDSPLSLLDLVYVLRSKRPEHWLLAHQ